MDLFKSDVSKFVIIIILAAIIFFFLFRVLSGRNTTESFQGNLNSEMSEELDTQMNPLMEERGQPQINPSVPDINSINEAQSYGNETIPRLSPEPSQGLGNNEIFKPIDNGDGNNPFGLNGNQLPRDCYPKDQLTPSELLPGDPNSKWAQVNPSGQGDLKDQNFLNAGYHIGVNTVGQTLRNANLQLRSEPPNPQVKVSPWLQTTIEPDTNRRAMEIGGCE